MILHGATAMRFQSLFFWIPPGKHKINIQEESGLVVSILVLLDTSRKVERTPEQQARFILFQSLFFWIPPGKYMDEKGREVFIGVSILVLLDTSRKAGALLT